MKSEEIVKLLQKSESNIVNRLQALDNKIENIDIKCDGLNSRFDTVERGLKKIDERLARIEKWVPVENSDFKA